MKYEVKYLFGGFCSYGKNDMDKTPIDAALEYVDNAAHAERYCVAAIQRGGRGRAGRVFVMVYERNAIRAALERYAAGVRVPALGVRHAGGIGVKRCEYAAIRQSFGAPLAEIATEYTKREDIKPDAGCVNAPYARAWEKICAKALGGRWVGGLHNVQIDIVVNEDDD